MEEIRSIGSHLKGLVPSAGESTIQSVCDGREVYHNESLAYVPVKMRDLCYADLLKVIVGFPSNTTGSNNSDAGWKSEEGGVSYSESDKKRMWETANLIHKKYADEKYEQKFGFKIVNI